MHHTSTPFLNFSVPPSRGGNRNLLPSPFKKAGDPNYVYRQPPTPLYGHPSQIPHFWQAFCDNVAPMKFRTNTKINSCGKLIYSFLEGKKTLGSHYANSFFVCVQAVFTLSLSISIKCPKNLKHFFGESLMFIIQKHVTTKWTPANFKKDQ